MRDLDAPAGHLADADGFGDGLLELGSLVAHVRGVNAAGVRGHPGKVDDLRHAGVGAGHVLKTGREPDGAVGHRLPDERLHAGHLGDLGRAVLGSHDGAAHGVVADERREIDGGGAFPQRRQRRPDVQRGSAAIAGDDRGHAHPREVGGGGPIDQAVGMGMDVDEAGGDSQAGRVDDLGGLRPGNPPDRRNLSVLDGHVGDGAGAARAIDDRAAGNEKVVSRGLPGVDSGGGGERARQ